MKWIGQHVYDLASKFRNTVDFSEDVTFYQPVNNANPTISIGASDDERFRILVNYQGTTTQEAQIVSLKTFTEGSAANDGRFQFIPDGVHVLSVDDGGIDFEAGFGISINGTDIITDSSGTATLSNIDALDVTTIATFEDAMEANLDAIPNLTSIGTIATGVWNGTAIASAYLDADTAHLSTGQTFTGINAFGSAVQLNSSTGPKVSIDGNTTMDPAVGAAAINIDAFDVTDAATSASGTAAIFMHVGVEAPRLLATNSSVTTTTASTLYVKGPPVASTNQTITHAYSLLVDSGDVRIDEDLIVGGNIDLEGDIDVNGTLETDALTIAGATIAAIGTTAITTLGTIGTGVWNATAIASAKMATGTASAQGALELATTGEADTGTDTARAVTPAGLKSHVDANARKCILRHHAFYVNDNPMVQNNLYFGGNLGHQPSNWNDPAPLTSQTDAASAGVSGIIGDPDGYTFTIAKGDENWGMVLPFDISKVEVQCSLQPQLGTGDDFTVAIYTGIRPNDSAAVLTLTKVAHQSIAFSSGSNRTMINDVSLTADLAKNTMIYVGLGSEDNTDAKNGRGYLTVTVTER